MRASTPFPINSMSPFIQGNSLLTFGFCVLLLVFIPFAVLADTIINGRVTDSIEKMALSGAKISLRHGQQEINTVYSDANGYFQLLVDLPESKEPYNLVLVAELSNFSPYSRNIQVVFGRATESIYQCELPPIYMGKCRPRDRHSVIIGHFLSPTIQELSNLPDRIAITLTFDLNVRLQQLHLPFQMQPNFISCQEAKLRSITQGKYYAAALGADAFISGSLEAGQQGYHVTTYLMDSYGIYPIPFFSRTENVNIDNPHFSHLDSKTHAAILVAVAAGYEKEKKYAEGVTATMIAEQLLGYTSDEIKTVREKCQNHLPHNGLLPR